MIIAGAIWLFKVCGQRQNQSLPSRNYATNDKWG